MEDIKGDLNRSHIIVFFALGHGQDCNTVLATKTSGEELKAETRSGECVLGTGETTYASSIHEIKVELNKMNVQKITMTLDCCRTVSRGDQERLMVDLW